MDIRVRHFSIIICLTCCILYQTFAERGTTDGPRELKQCHGTLMWLCRYVCCLLHAVSFEQQNSANGTAAATVPAQIQVSCRRAMDDSWYTQIYRLRLPQVSP